MRGDVDHRGAVFDGGVRQRFGLEVDDLGLGDGAE
jgi:hypothetical protein